MAKITMKSSVKIHRSGLTFGNAANLSWDIADVDFDQSVVWNAYTADLGSTDTQRGVCMKPWPADVWALVVAAAGKITTETFRWTRWFFIVFSLIIIISCESFYSDVCEWGIFKYVLTLRQMQVCLQVFSLPALSSCFKLGANVMSEGAALSMLQHSYSSPW